MYFILSSIMWNVAFLLKKKELDSTSKYLLKIAIEVNTAYLMMICKILPRAH